MNKPRINPFSKDLFTALADVQFQQIVTTRMLPTLYICGIIFAGIAASYLVASTWTENSWPARIAWCGIFAPALFMASVVAWRIILELCFSFFQIVIYVRELHDEVQRVAGTTVDIATDLPRIQFWRSYKGGKGASKKSASKSRDSESESDGNKKQPDDAETSVKKDTKPEK